MAKTERIQNMTKGSPAKLIFTFAIPLMLGNVFQQFYTVVDTAIVGQALGVNALAALGAADWLNWLVLGLIQGFAQGFSIYMAQRFGAEDHEGLNRSIGATISLSAVISILTVILSQVAMAPVLRAMNTPEEIIGGAHTCASCLRVSPSSWRITCLQASCVRSATAKRRCMPWSLHLF